MGGLGEDTAFSKSETNDTQRYSVSCLFPLRSVGIHRSICHEREVALADTQ